MSSQRRFSCTEPGCGKAFYRSEHLSRHRLNHRPKQVFQCPSCPKKFVRKDLLQRHEKRHERGMWLRNSGGVITPASQHQQDVDDPLEASSQWESSTEPPFTGHPPDGPDLNSPELGETSQDQQQQDVSATEQQPDGMVPRPHFVSSSPSSAEMGMVGNSLFVDPSAEVQASQDQIDWLFEGVPHEISPVDAMPLHDMPPAYPAYGFSPHTGYHTAQPQASAPIQVPGGLPAAPGGIPQAVSGGNDAFAPPIPTTYSSSTTTPWQIVRTRLLESLCSLPPDILGSSFFYPSSLAGFYELYFQNYHPHFPILHPPTLHPADASPLLIAAIMTLGATLTADENHYRIATRIHDGLRWIVFGTGTFEPPAPLWCLQTLMLLQAREKMFSTRKHHEMAHIFHGAIITLMKRGTAYSAISNQPEQPSGQLEQNWYQWISDEASKRTAFFAFIMDAQHNFLFGHNSALAAHDVQLNLPCADILWEQQTAQGWNQVAKQTSESPQFLPALKGLLAKNPIPPICSAYSRLILLHGLFSVTSNLQARDLATLGVGRPGSSSDDNSPAPSTMDFWKGILERAIDTWSFSLRSSDRSLSLEAARTLHHMAHVAIYTNVIDFHIVAKAPPLLGTPVTRSDYTKAKSRVRSWSKKPETKKALYHCVRLVQETVFAGWRYRASEDNIALRPWCLYHATLILWAYGYMVEESGATKTKNLKKRKLMKIKDLTWRPSPTQQAHPEPKVESGRTDSTAVGAEEYLVRMLMLLEHSDGPTGAGSHTISAYDYDEDQKAPIPADINEGDTMLEGANQTRELILFVRESLDNCRWELLQEAYVTLGRLAGLSDPGYSESTAATVSTNFAPDVGVKSGMGGPWR